MTLGDLFRRRTNPAPNAAGEQAGHPIDAAAEPAATPTTDAERVADASVAGERALPSINRERSLQSRVNNLLALAVVSLLGGGFLVWYYSAVLQRAADAQAKREQERTQKAGGELKLPPLGAVEAPKALTDAKRAEEGAALLGKVLGPAPPLAHVPHVAPAPHLTPAAAPAAIPVATPAAAGTPRAPTAAELELARQLTPSVLYRQNGTAQIGGSGAPTGSPASAGTASIAAFPPLALAGAPVTPSAVPIGSAPPPQSVPSAMVPASTANAPGSIGSYLTPTVTPAASAQLLATRRFLIPKGNFLDCTLETALDSQLPGLVTCVTAVDIFGADGKVVLIERGSKLVGESKGEVRQGMSRIFVLWNEVRTPAGVLAQLNSPATDALGRSGMQGEVDTHFWSRFGAAILISVIDGAVQAAVQAQRRSSGGTPTVVYSPQGTQQVMSEVLRNTIAIPPTVVVNQGERVQVLVARDVDFRSVYELRPR